MTRLDVNDLILRLEDLRDRRWTFAQSIYQDPKVKESWLALEDNKREWQNAVEAMDITAGGHFGLIFVRELVAFNPRYYTHEGDDELRGVVRALENMQKWSEHAASYWHLEANQFANDHYRLSLVYMAAVQAALLPRRAEWDALVAETSALFDEIEARCQDWHRVGRVQP